MTSPIPVSKLPSLIKKTDLISEIITRYPSAAEILITAGLACAHCPFSRSESLVTGAKLHGLAAADIDALVKQINAHIKNQNQE